MPVASSRRRSNARAQATSDIEDGLTQRSAREDVDEDEEDEQPRRAVKQEKKAVATKGKGRAKQAQENADEDDDDDDDDDRIDVDNFANQPIVKADVAKMKGLSTDWGSMVKNISRASNMVENVAISVADNSQGDDAQKGLLELERLLKEFIDIESEMQINADVIDSLGNQIAGGEEIDNIVEQYEEQVQNKKDAYSDKTTRQKYAKNDAFKSFKQALHEIDHPNDAMPPITEFMPKEPGDDSDDDDELEMGSVTQDYKCPLTLRPLENPVTSQVCGHSFSQEAIRQYFGNSGGSKNCPSSGCQKTFRLSDCKMNKDLARKIKLHERRLKRKEQEMEAEEIVE